MRHICQYLYSARGSFGFRPRERAYKEGAGWARMMRLSHPRARIGQTPAAPGDASDKARRPCAWAIYSAVVDEGSVDRGLEPREITRQVIDEHPGLEGINRRDRGAHRPHRLRPSRAARPSLQLQNAAQSEAAARGHPRRPRTLSSHRRRWAQRVSAPCRRLSSTPAGMPPGNRR